MLFLLEPATYTWYLSAPREKTQDQELGWMWSGFTPSPSQSPLARCRFLVSHNFKSGWSRSLRFQGRNVLYHGMQQSFRWGRSWDGHLVVLASWSNRQRKGPRPLFGGNLAPDYEGETRVWPYWEEKKCLQGRALPQDPSWHLSAQRF